MQNLDLSALSIDEFSRLSPQKEVEDMARSAKMVLNEKAFGVVMNEIARETVMKILDAGTTDEEANILRRLVERLSDVQTRLIQYSELSSPPVLPAEEIK